MNNEIAKIKNYLEEKNKEARLKIEKREADIEELFIGQLLDNPSLI